MPSFETTSFTSVVAISEQFETRLSDHGIRVHPGSHLAQMRKRLLEVLQIWQSGAAPAGYDALGALREVTGYLHLCETVLQSHATIKSTDFTNRLKVLGHGDPNFYKTTRQSTERDLALELLLGLMIEKWAADVRLDEPDVTALYRGQRVGVACKVNYHGPDAAVEPVRKGIDQIGRSGVDWGLVFVHVGSTFPHESLLPHDDDGDLLSPRYAVGASISFNRAFRAHTDPFVEKVSEALARRPPKHLGLCRAIVFVVQTVTTVRAVVSRIAGMRQLNIDHTDGPHQAFVQSLNTAIQGGLRARNSSASS